MDTVRVASVPFDDSDLRARLTREIAAQGAIHLPGVLFAGTGTERRIATVLDPRPDLTGRIERAWLADPSVRWTGAWGTQLLERGGRPLLAAFVRVRWPDERGFAAVWARLPGVAPAAEDAETWEGPLDALPKWLHPLFPALAEGAVKFERAELEPAPWPGRPDVRKADLVVDVGATASLADIARAVGQRLEARFATTGKLDLAAVALHENRVEVWVGEDAEEHGRKAAMDDRTRVVGVFGGGIDNSVVPEARMIGVAVESRGGDAITWRRRYEMVDDQTARWRGDAVLTSGPQLGWFAAWSTAATYSQA